MALDKDWLKVMGEDFIPMSAKQVATPEEENETPVEVPTWEPVVEEAVDAPVVEEPWLPPEAPEEPATDVEQEEPTPATEEEPTAAPAKTPEEQAEDIINELLWDVAEVGDDLKEQGKSIDDAIDKTEDTELKKELEALKIQNEDSSTKLAAVKTEYKKVLDKNMWLEARVEEFDSKMRIISDNPLLQDLIRWLYLWDTDATAITTVEWALKKLLKEHSDIDVDTLITQARWSAAQWLASSEQEWIIWNNQAYKGLFDDGDVIPLN